MEHTKSWQPACVCNCQVEQLHSEDLAQVQSRYKALDLPLGQLEDHKWVMQLGDVGKTVWDSEFVDG